MLPLVFALVFLVVPYIYTLIQDRKRRRKLAP